MQYSNEKWVAVIIYYDMKLQTTWQLIGADLSEQEQKGFEPRAAR